MVSDLDSSISGTESGIHVFHFAAAVTGPSVGVPGQPLSFTLQATPDSVPANIRFTYAIHWGDGTPLQTMTGPNGLTVSHIYIAPGSRTVQITVTFPGSKPALATAPVGVLPVVNEDDPARPGSRALFVGGTPGNDTIVLVPDEDLIRVDLNGVPEGLVEDAGHIYIYTQGGADVVRELGNSFDSISVPAIVFGGPGNKTFDFSRSAGNNILLGGPSADTLIGGSGRDILIGGGGKDRLQAGRGGDILIGGTTSLATNVQALAAVMDEWANTDSYATRVGDLLGTLSGGANGGALLNASTVTDDGLANLLAGGSNQDWYFAGLFDVLTNLTPGETVTAL
jgi:hypothetical protein